MWARLTRLSKKSGVEGTCILANAYKHPLTMSMRLVRVSMCLCTSYYYAWMYDMSIWYHALAIPWLMNKLSSLSLSPPVSLSFSYSLPAFMPLLYSSYWCPAESLISLSQVANSLITVQSDTSRSFVLKYNRTSKVVAAEANCCLDAMLERAMHLMLRHLLMSACTNDLVGRAVQYMAIIRKAINDYLWCKALWTETSMRRQAGKTITLHDWILAQVIVDLDTSYKLNCMKGVVVVYCRFFLYGKNVSVWPESDGFFLRVVLHSRSVDFAPEKHW